MREHLFRRPTLLKRHAENPILTPADFAGEDGLLADCVFNPGQTTFRGKTLLLVAVQPRNRSYAQTHVATSSDGLHFEIDPRPCFFHDPEKVFGEYDNHPIDNRITKIGDEYYICRPGNSPRGCVGLLYKTSDFKEFTPVDIIALPDNRVPCIFPEKIDGYYWRLERPYANGAADCHGHIWLSRSPDLIHWGHHRFLLKGFTGWNWEKIGPTVPVKTEKGWLEIFHGVSGSCSVTSYSLGAMLLDLNAPSKILGVCKDYILTAEKPYEFMGRCPGVVFATGAIADPETRELRCYYGCADTCIGLATGNLDEIVDACLAGGCNPED